MTTDMNTETKDQLIQRLKKLSALKKALSEPRYDLQKCTQLASISSMKYIDEECPEGWDHDYRSKLNLPDEPRQVNLVKPERPHLYKPEKSDMIPPAVTIGVTIVVMLLTILCFRFHLDFLCVLCLVGLFFCVIGIGAFFENIKDWFLYKKKKNQYEADMAAYPEKCEEYERMEFENKKTLDTWELTCIHLIHDYYKQLIDEHKAEIAPLEKEFEATNTLHLEESTDFDLVADLLYTGRADTLRDALLEADRRHEEQERTAMLERYEMERAVREQENMLRQEKQNRELLSIAKEQADIARAAEEKARSDRYKAESDAKLHICPSCANYIGCRQTGTPNCAAYTPKH